MINALGDGVQMTSDDEADSEPSIILVSTRTVDRVPTPDGILEVAGGPPRFVVPALETLGWRCRVVTGPLATVEVVVYSGGEEYVVPTLPLIHLPACLHADAIILSPIMREINIQRLPRFEGMVVADLQGFVRNPGVPSGRLNNNVDLTPLLGHVAVVKATTSELAALSKPSRAMLSGKVLLLTRGRAGALVIQGDRTATVESRTVSGVPTIGAGDTFLACFTGCLLNGATAEEAALAAARFTEAFLETRRSG